MTGGVFAQLTVGTSTLQALSLLVVGLLNIGVGVHTLSSRRISTARPFSLLLFSIGLWTVSQGFLLGVSGQWAAYVLETGIHVGAVVGSTAVMHFGLSFTQRTAWLESRRMGIVYGVTGIWCLLFVTNPIHGWVLITGAHAGALIPVDAHLQPLYWVYMGYCWSLVASGLVVLAAEFRSVDTSSIYARQIGLIVIAGSLPFAANVLAYTGATATNYSHWAFGATGLLAAAALYKYRWLDLVPVGRDRVIEQFRDGYLVIDAEHRVVDSNPAAKELLEVTNPVGKHIKDVCPDCQPLLDGDASERQLSLDSATIRVSASEVTTNHGDGSVLILRDITERERVERRFKALIENISDLITVIDEDGTITYVSPLRDGSDGLPT